MLSGKRGPGGPPNNRARRSRDFPLSRRAVQAALPDVDVIGIFVYADEAVRHARIANETIPSERGLRVRQAQPILARYCEAPLFYRHVLLNIFDEATFERHVDELLEMYRYEQQGEESLLDNRAA